MHRVKVPFMPVAAILGLTAVLCLTLSLAAQGPAPKTTQPKVIYKVEPQYTEAAKTAKVSGSVLLSLVVDENGDAQEIQVARSLDEGLDQNAIAAVRQWRFAPATEDGKPVAFPAKIEVNFRLQ